MLTVICAVILLVVACRLGTSGGRLGGSSTLSASLGIAGFLTVLGLTFFGGLLTAGIVLVGAAGTGGLLRARTNATDLVRGLLTASALVLGLLTLGASLF